jgi:transposase
MKKKNIVSSFDKYENTEGDYVSVIAAASVEGVLHFSIKHGFYTRREFCECVFRCFANVRDMKYHNRYYDMSEKKAYLITDMNKIHLDPEGEHEDKPIARVLAEIRANRLFLPPASPQLNPLDSIFTNLKHRLQKRDIRSHNDLL